MVESGDILHEAVRAKRRLELVALLADAGLLELGLPETYPVGAEGDIVSHATCQPIGKAVFDAGLDGVDVRSAASGGVRELAWFPRNARASEDARRAFDEWW